MSVRKVSRAKPAPETLRFEDFREATSLGIRFPTLALYIEIEGRQIEDTLDYRFKHGRVWHKLAHTTGGHACNERYLIVTALTPKSYATEQSINLFATVWFDSQIQRGSPLESLLDYRASLYSYLAADCNYSYESLEEALLPIDIGFLPQLAADKLPQDLDELAEWENGYHRASQGRRWALAVLAKNSD